MKGSQLFKEYLFKIYKSILIYKNIKKNMSHHLYK